MPNLFWSLQPEVRAKLMMFYWDNFHQLLEIPPEPETWSPKVAPVVTESSNEIDYLMRQPPSRSRDEDAR